MSDLSNRLEILSIYYVNKELPRFDHLKTYTDLKLDFEEFLKGAVPWMLCIAIDEIQQIKERERFINGYRTEYETQIEILITWSNSFLLSGELATYLTWRYIDFYIYPLSFSEYCQFNLLQKTKSSLEKYMKYWWLPWITLLPQDDESIFAYLRSVYETIVFKDILWYNTIKNIQFFKDLYKFVYANIWSIVTATSIHTYLKSQNISISTDTILSYLKYGQDSFILSKVRSVHPNTKKYFQIYNKWYASDLGMRNAMVGYNSIRDRGKVLENYVYLELLRQWYDVLIGRLETKEIDFIAMKWSNTVYIQVSFLLWSTSTIEREISSLQKVKSSWPKLIITNDEEWVIEGVRICSVINLEQMLEKLFVE